MLKINERLKTYVFDNYEKQTLKQRVRSRILGTLVVTTLKNIPQQNHDKKDAMISFFVKSFSNPGIHGTLIARIILPDVSNIVYVEEGDFITYGPTYLNHQKHEEMCELHAVYSSVLSSFYSLNLVDVDSKTSFSREIQYICLSENEAPDEALFCLEPINKLKKSDGA
jgi:hypothetical protein